MRDAPPMDDELAALIRRLDLQPHPEGGWFRETWRDARAVRAEGFDAPRSASTAIHHDGASSLVNGAAALKPSSSPSRTGCCMRAHDGARRSSTCAT